MNIVLYARPFIAVRTSWSPRQGQRTKGMPTGQRTCTALMSLAGKLIR